MATFLPASPPATCLQHASAAPWSKRHPGRRLRGLATKLGEKGGLGVFGGRMSCPRWRAEPAGAGRRDGAGAARRFGAAPASASRRDRARQLSLRGRRAKLPALGPSGGRCGLVPRLLPLPRRPAAGPFLVHGPPPLAADLRRSGGALGSRGFPRLLSSGDQARQAGVIGGGGVRWNVSSFELCRSAPPTRSLAGPARGAATPKSTPAPSL